MAVWLNKILRTYRSIDVHKLTEAIAIGIFGVGAITSYGLATTAYNTGLAQYNELVDRRASAMRTHIRFEFSQYEQILKTAAAFSQLNGQDMNREMWRQYVERGGIITDHPAMLGLGYVEVFADNERAAYVEALNEEYSQPVSLLPNETRSLYTSISYLEPLNDSNRRAVGYDMFTEPARRAAMERARDRQVVALSAPVQLVQDQAADDVYGVLMYYPVYSGGGVPDTVSERREALKGYVYVVVRPADVAQLIDRDTVTDQVDFELRDGAAVMYSSIENNTIGEIRQLPHDMYGRSWTIASRVDLNMINYWSGSVLIMLLGTVISGLLAVTVYRLLSRRITYLEKEHDESIAATRSELVMLASHQLRTPASGVKQYLGMLTEGLVGNLGQVERDIITKAYNANERQLETIDQILHVARADAGQLALQYSRFDLVKLVGKVAEEAADDAERKTISINIKGALTMSIMADRRYMTMALENLVSNAIKYSYPNSAITIATKATSKVATIEVQDEGVGIDEKRSDEIFEKFVRIDNPLSVQEGGTGLGLFLVKQIAIAHCGTIELAKNQLNGSTFILTIPRKKPARRYRNSSKR